MALHSVRGNRRKKKTVALNKFQIFVKNGKSLPSQSRAYSGITLLYLGTQVEKSNVNT